jgi:hypothetical protein
LAPLACGVLLIFVALPLEALASTNSATGVEAPLPAKADASPGVNLDPVSCGSGGNCIALGGYGVGGSVRSVLLSETSGRWATGVEVGAAPSLPANGRTHPNADLSDVSCASAGNCTAVGYYFDNSRHEQGLLSSETSGRWATGVEARLPANANTSHDAYLEYVSCASAGNCTATGGYFDRSRHEQVLLLTETSGRSATGVEARLPANADTNPNADLNSVSCASAGNCTAVGYYFDNSRHEQVLLLTETSGRWATGVEASLPAGANPQTDDRNYSSGQVSCGSAGNCTAIDSYGVGDPVDNESAALLLTETSGRWATGVEAPVPANGLPNSSELGSVSCASAGNCTAVGFYLVPHGPQLQLQGLALTETSGTWATGVAVSLPANADTTNNDAGGTLNAVSCASAGHCTAVGLYEDTSGQHQALLSSETSGTWATGVEVPLPANADTHPDAHLPNSLLRSLSCASAGNCTAVGEYIDRSGHEQGLLVSVKSAR